MYKLCFLIFCVFLIDNAQAQCKNSLAVKKVSDESKSGKGGVIEVSITGSGAFVCLLNIEKGSGPEKAQEKRGNGNSIIRFENLKTEEIYQVLVEFANEDKTHCKKLMKSLITIETE